MAASAPLHQKPLTSSGSQPGREEVRSCVRRHWETSAGFWEANCFLSVSARRLRRDEMFLSVSNSSRRKFWAADERCGAIVEVPKRRKTKPIVSLSSLTKSHISGSYFVFCKGGKKYPDFDFSWYMAHMETQSLASAHQGPSLPVLCEVTYIMMWIFLALLLPTYW